MLDQLADIVKQLGQDTVVNNPDVPNQYNQDIMSDATHTIAGGFQNILAGGGFQNILDLFKGGGGGSATGAGLGGLLQSPIVSMMIGHFMSKLVGKYNMNPDAASKVANNLIPNSINNLIQRTNDPGNEKATMDGLIGSLVGKMGAAESNNTQSNSASPLQDLLDQFTSGGKTGSGNTGGFDLQNIISSITQKAQNSLQNQESGGGNGLMDLIKGFIG